MSIWLLTSNKEHSKIRHQFSISQIRGVGYMAILCGHNHQCEQVRRLRVAGIQVIRQNQVVFSDGAFAINNDIRQNLAKVLICFASSVAIRYILGWNTSICREQINEWVPDNTYTRN